MPQRSSSWRDELVVLAPGTRRRTASQYARFARACSVSPSDELIGGEPEPDLALGRLRRVGAVHEVVRHREREVAADRPRRRVDGVRGAHRRPDDRDRRLALEHERERRRRGDELDELAEERLLARARRSAARRARDRRGGASRPAIASPRCSKRARISPASPRSMASGLIRTRVRSHARPASAGISCFARQKIQQTCAPGRPHEPDVAAHGCVLADVSRAMRSRPRACSTGVSQYGQICQSGSSGALQRRHACFSFVVQTGQARNAGSMSARQTGQRSRRRGSPPWPGSRARARARPRGTRAAGRACR